MVAGSSRSVGEVSDGVIVVLYIVIGPAAGDIAYGFLGIPPERLAPVSDDGLKSFDSLAAIFVELLVEVFHYLRLPQRPLCAAFLLCLPPRLGFISSSTNYVPHRSKYGREVVNVVQRGSDAVRIGFQPSMMTGSICARRRQGVRCGVQSCRSWPPRLRRGRGGQDRSCCKRAASDTHANCSGNISTRRASTFLSLQT
jgi:hypothetical protein